MPVGRFIGAQCVNRDLCNPGKPARPVYMHGFCWFCWCGLAASQKRVAVWEDAQADEPTQQTEPIDSLAIARWNIQAEEIAGLPEFKGERKWAA